MSFVYFVDSITRESLVEYLELFYHPELRASVHLVMLSIIKVHKRPPNVVFNLKYLLSRFSIFCSLCVLTYFLPSSVSITISWTPLELEGVDYNTSITPFQAASTTSIVIPNIPYNTQYTITVVVSNCTGSSTVRLRDLWIYWYFKARKSEGGGVERI